MLIIKSDCSLSATAFMENLLRVHASKRMQHQFSMRDECLNRVISVVNNPPRKNAVIHFFGQQIQCKQEGLEHTTEREDDTDTRFGQSNSILGIALRDNLTSAIIANHKFSSYKILRLHKY
ncbi:hypothetical protein LOAG_05739 [Loa loa]|uniref:Uncharacterized protein n=1 Tax=Loa loa TaxID=7209 RepID=A0A1S0U0X5_LOALO|nr:hypothetical protein LOAG_05739 [Loa loa]EFO22740.1 hypothetical protein LOAG_05739 [Loa loa]